MANNKYNSMYPKIKQDSAYQSVNPHMKKELTVEEYYDLLQAGGPTIPRQAVVPEASPGTWLQIRELLHRELAERGLCPSGASEETDN